MHPQALIEEFLVFIGLMVLLGSVTKIILSIVHRRRDGRDTNAPMLLEISQRLARLEQAVDTTAVEVERIAEGQRFTTKLLAERAGQGRAAEQNRGQVITPH